ncbi:MAG: TRAP transporter substrate-binding protein [Pseudaminobacter sp.]
MKTIIKILPMAAAAALALGAATFSANADEKIKLSFAYFASEQSYPGPVMTEWVKRIEEATNGQVSVDKYPDGTLLKRDEMFDGVLSGVVDIGMSSIADPGRFPVQYGIGLPLGLEDGRIASIVAYDLVNEFQPKELADFKVLTIMATGPGYLQTSSPMTSLADLKGKEVRGTGGGVDVLRSLGAAPVGMPITEVPQALQTGVIDGYMTSIEVIKEFKLAEMVKHVTEYPMNVLTFAVVMNKAKWDSLPKNVQDAIDAVSRDLAVFAGELYDERAEEAIEWAKSEYGVEFHQLADEEAAKWTEATAPLVQAWVKKQEAAGLPAQDFLDRLAELRKENAK